MSTKSNDGFSMPTMKETISVTKDLGLLAGGLIAAHSVVALTKKDTLLVNGGLMVAGVGAALAFKHPIARMLGLGAATYGAVKMISFGLKEIATPNTTEGLNGLLPEKAKAMLRRFVPTLSGMDEAVGINGLGNTDDEFAGLSLDEFGTRDSTTYNGIEENAAGFGSIAEMAA